MHIHWCNLNMPWQIIVVLIYTKLNLWNVYLNECMCIHWQMIDTDVWLYVISIMAHLLLLLRCRYLCLCTLWGCVSQCYNALQYVAMCCNVLQCCVVYCSMSNCFAAWQYVVIWCCVTIVVSMRIQRCLVLGHCIFKFRMPVFCSHSVLQRADMCCDGERLKTLDINDACHCLGYLSYLSRGAQWWHERHKRGSPWKYKSGT